MRKGELGHEKGQKPALCQSVASAVSAESAYFPSAPPPARKLSMSTSASVEGEAAEGQSLRRRYWTSHVAFFALWCVAVGLLSVAALRVVWHDGTRVLTWLNAFTFYLYLPAYLVAAIAIWLRRW